MNFVYQVFEHNPGVFVPFKSAHDEREYNLLAEDAAEDFYRSKLPEQVEWPITLEVRTTTGEIVGSFQVLLYPEPQFFAVKYQ